MSIFAKFAFFLLTAASLPAAAAPYTIAALSADADAVVLAAPGGSLQRLRRGDSLPQSDWRVGEVRGGRVTFLRQRPHDGAGLAISAARGERIDFDALDRRDGSPPAAAPAIDGRFVAPRARAR